jgi:hypothetical protein
VWKLEERVVKLRPGDVMGGKGSVLNAGFEVLPDEEEDGGGGAGAGRGRAVRPAAAAAAAAPQQRRRESRSEQQARAGSPPYSGWESEEEWSKRWADAALSDEDEYDPDGQYEILLSGSVRIRLAGSCGGFAVPG